LAGSTTSRTLDRHQDEWIHIKDFINRSPHIAFSDAERYKRPPDGYAPDHPLLDDLKLKTFFAGRSFTNAEVTSPDFVASIVETFANLAPFMQFINEALGLSF
jgi:uncharacterized protein (DUF2461 family)